MKDDGIKLNRNKQSNDLVLRLKNFPPATDTKSSKKHTKSLGVPIHCLHCSCFNRLNRLERKNVCFHTKTVCSKVCTNKSVNFFS